ncbi:hypothetical protein [Cohnella soli]|uniref:Copper amine oxidase-like N-terminal domain-containing protein n=1 Tax=Cohnella soli TaxID=425005 RepID=A0ABW0HXR6_9BACL
MKKSTLLLTMLVCSTLIGGSLSASAHSVAPKAAELSVLVNGVPVQSSDNHTWNGKTYVSVAQFAKLFNKTAIVGKDNKSVTFNGKTISNVRLHEGTMTAWIRDLADAVHAQAVTVDATKNEVYVLALPEGTVQITPLVPAMGEHWSNPQAGDLPTGPIYGVYKGKLVFLEYMVAQEDFVAGKNHVNVPGMKGYPSPSVVQFDLEFQEHGHEGFEVPHYDIHAYFISDEEQQKIK